MTAADYATVFGYVFLLALFIGILFGRSWSRASRIWDDAPTTTQRRVERGGCK